MPDVYKRQDINYAADGGLYAELVQNRDFEYSSKDGSHPVSYTHLYACRIPQNSELINQTSMSADAGGHPYIASYWRDPDSDVPQYRIVWHDGQMWHSRPVSGRTTPFSLKGGGTKMIRCV